MSADVKVFSVKAGRYFVGDPCYLFHNPDVWMDLLESCSFFDNPEGVVKGQKVYASPTQNGDGIYGADLGLQFPVDSGLIGIVPEAPALECLEGTEPYGVVLVEFEKPFLFKTLDNTGVISIGHIRVYTGYEYEECQ